MKIGSGLASAAHLSPELVTEAVEQALSRAGTACAEQVVLLLTHDFQRQVPAALRQAARSAGCLQIAGCTVGGIFTDAGWRIDQPAAAALVLADLPTELPTAPVMLSFSNQGRLAADWQAEPRIGLVDSQGSAWQQGRLSNDLRSSLTLRCETGSILRSRGQRRLGEPASVDLIDGLELRRCAGQHAVAWLLRLLPPALRERPPLHALSLCRVSDGYDIPVISINDDGSLTIAESLAAGEQVQWSLRQPLTAASEIQQQFAAAARHERPAGALMFSCIGRGPLFYGDDDADLAAFVEHFPGVPLIGGYGTGQIHTTSHGNRLMHNSALTLLLKDPDVQSLP